MKSSLRRLPVWSRWQSDSIGFETELQCHILHGSLKLFCIMLCFFLHVRSAWLYLRESVLCLQCCCVMDGSMSLSESQRKYILTQCSWLSCCLINACSHKFPDSCISSSEQRSSLPLEEKVSKWHVTESRELVKEFVWVWLVGRCSKCTIMEATLEHQDVIFATIIEINENAYGLLLPIVLWNASNIHMIMAYSF